MRDLSPDEFPSSGDSAGQYAGRKDLFYMGLGFLQLIR
jgi:hypothetical protein